jgi:hypothetical protein
VCMICNVKKLESNGHFKWNAVGGTAELPSRSTGDTQRFLYV